jgi:NADPH:quinone reductase-like Zn-dependent oxidoreductase
VLRRALAERGTLVIVGADGAGGPVLDGLQRQLGAMLLSPWVRHRLTSVVQAERAADLAILLDHLASGRLRAPIDDIAPMDAAHGVIDRLQQQRTAGKGVIELLSEPAGS